MFTPEHGAPNHAGQFAQDSAVEARRTAELTTYTDPANPTRTTRAVSWIGWHAIELGGVAVPLGLAVAVWNGFYVVSGLVALTWAANEVRLSRQARAPRTGKGAGESTQDGEVSL